MFFMGKLSSHNKTLFWWQNFTLHGKTLFFTAKLFCCIALARPTTRFAWWLMHNMLLGFCSDSRWRALLEKIQQWRLRLKTFSQLLWTIDYLSEFQFLLVLCFAFLPKFYSESEFCFYYIVLRCRFTGFRTECHVSGICLICTLVCIITVLQLTSGRFQVRLCCLRFYNCFA